MDISFIYHIFRKCGTVTTDTRNILPDALFISLKGERFNGNHFASKALEQGCAYAIVDEPEYYDAGNERLILVKNALQTLQQLARHHRRQMGTKVIGITGTNGKTTTKELIAAVLTESYTVLYTQGNLNNHIGVPLTLLQLNPIHEIAVIEMGASRPGDIRELAEIAEPDYGIITNVGKAHLEGFGSFEGVMKTKGELYAYLRKASQHTLFVNADHTYLREMSEGMNILFYGRSPQWKVNGEITAADPYLCFEWQDTDNGKRYPVATRLIGNYNFENALAAVATGCFFGIEPEKINHAITSYIPRNNRSQLQETGSNYLILDAYNANPTSMHAAILNFREMAGKRKMVILGDMKELGKDSLCEHRAILALLETSGFEKVVLIGEQFQKANTQYDSFPDTETALLFFREHQPHGYHILIKGSNSMGLNRLAACL